MKCGIKSPYGNILGTGLRKVINSLVSAVKNIDSKSSVLGKLGIKKSEIVDANGNLRSLTDIMGVLNKHTQDMEGADKNAIFNALFGTTGQQAGMILAENSKRLGELTEKTQAAADKGKYVQTLSQKNSETAQANTQKFKKAWEDLEIKFGAELLPYMTEATKSLSDLFSQKDFQESVKSAASGIGKVASWILKVAEGAIKYRSVIWDFAKILGKLWVVDKVVNFIIKIQKLKDVFGGLSSKIVEEQTKVASLTAEYQKLAEAKTAASNAYTETPVKSASKTGEAVEEVATNIPTAGGKAKGVGTKVAKEVESEIATSGAVATGVAKSAEVATKSSKLMGAVKFIGNNIGSFIGIGISLLDVGASIVSAVRKGTTDSKVAAVSKTAGGTIGGLIGFATGGPMGAAIGSQLGITLGSSKTVQKIVKGTGKAFKEANKQISKQNYVITSNGVTMGIKEVKIKKSSLTKAQKSIVRDLNKTMDKTDLAAIKMSVKTDKKSLDKSADELKKYYASILKTAQTQSKKRADSEKKAVEEMYKQHKISKQQYDQYIKDINAADDKRKKKNQETYQSLTKQTDNYNKKLQSITNQSEKKLESIANTYKNRRKNLAAQEATAISNAKAAGYVKIGQKTYKGEEAVRKIQEQYKKKRTKLAQQEKKDQEKVTKETAKAKEKVTESYNKTRLKKLKALSKSIAKEMGSSSKQQKEILKKLSSDKGKLTDKEAKDLINKSAKEANRIIKNAEKTRKETVTQAKKNYEEKKAQYEKMHQDIPGYTKSMMEKDIANAKSERDVTIEAAKEAKNKTVSSAKSKHDQVVDEASKQNKSVSSNVVAEGNNGIKAYNKWGAAVHNTLKFLSDAWSGIVKAFGGSFSGGVKGYQEQSLISSHATGGVAKTGLSLVGEAGPELVYTPWAKTARIVGQRGAEVTHLNQGEQVLNAQDTARVLSGSYTGILPGYAKGTGFSLSGLLSGIKDKVLDIADSMLDTLKKPVEWINNGFKRWTSVQAFDFTHSTLMDDTRDLAKKSIIKPVKDAFAKLLKGYEESGAANPGGSGVARWRPYVKKALGKLGLSTSESMIARVLRQINTESGGNPHAKQPGADPDGDGSGPALGLMQTKRSTFNSNALPGHHNIWNGYDNLLAGLNYARHRYGSSLSFLGNGHGYANGGLIANHGMYEVAEGNLPEMVIPLDLSKRSRAYQLMQRSLDYFAQSDNHAQHVVQPRQNDANQKLEQGFKLAIDLMAKILGVNEEQLNVLKQNKGTDLNSLYKRIAVDKGMRDYQGW